jgi:hypothetical protein
MNIVYYIHQSYIPQDICRLTDKFKLNPSVLTNEYFVVSYSACGNALLGFHQWVIHSVIQTEIGW